MSDSSSQEFTFQSLHRPLSYRAIDFLGSRLGSMGISIADINVDSLLERARKITHLNDFGDSSFEGPLSELVDSLNSEADLNFMGKYMMREMLSELLCERLRVQHYFKRFPEVSEEKIEKPLFITGLPRSGTRFLFNLLCQDPNSQWLKHWELHLPSQEFVDREEFDRAAEEKLLIKKSSADLKGFKSLVPNIDKCYIFGVTAPEECFRFLARSFVCSVFPVYAEVPSYFEQMKSEWWGGGADTQKLAEVYQYYRQQIQLVKHRRNLPQTPNVKIESQRHWVFKSPSHLMSLHAISEVFTDACLVHIHRDPLYGIPSNWSLLAMIRAAFSDRIDRQSMGRQLLQDFSYSINRALEIRRNNPSLNIIDISYDRFIANPVQVIRKIYQKFDYTFTEEVEMGIKNYILEDPHEKDGKHIYSLEQFGIEKEEVYDAFSEYYDYLNSINTD
ncbi:MAG: sulfotransferase [Cyanobacteriota bacterium]|nr:sulfotransferase [Cyanobacteriota bacterium]